MGGTGRALAGAEMQRGAHAIAVRETRQTEQGTMWVQVKEPREESDDDDTDHDTNAAPA